MSLGMILQDTTTIIEQGEKNPSIIPILAGEEQDSLLIPGFPVLELLY